MVEYHKKDYGSVFINKFRNHLWENGCMENTIDCYCISAKMFVDYTMISDENSISTITKARVREFVEHLRNDEYEVGKKYSISSVNVKIAGINQFFDSYGLNDLKAKSFRVQRKSFLNDYEILTKEEFNKLKTEAKKVDEKYYYLFLAMAQTGMRASETKFITYENLQKHYIDVFNKGSCRRIPMAEDLNELLDTYCSDKQITTGSIFFGKNEKPISRVEIAKKMKEIGLKAGIDKRKLHPHILRHFFAICFIEENGIDSIHMLADILGHKSVETTMIYIRATLKEMSKKLTLKQLGMDGDRK